MQTIRIMIVEDEEVIKDGLVNGIDWGAHNIEVVASAENGMDAYLLAHELNPDLIVTDVRMSVMDGLQLTEKLCNEMPSVRVIIISGYQEFEYAKRAIAFGVADYLLKPLDENELVGKVLTEAKKLEDIRRNELKRNLDYLLLKSDTNFMKECQRLERELITQIERMQGVRAAKTLDEIYTLFVDSADEQYYKAVCIRQFVYFKEIMECWGLSSMGADIDRLVENELYRFTDNALLRDWQKQKVMEFINMAGINKGSKFKKVVRKVEKYVEEHYAEDITLCGMAGLVFISPQYLSKIFRMEKGVSFVEWLNGYRIEIAKGILASGDRSITDVASLSGYNDYKYFSNVFKKYTGVTPRSYRKGEV